MFSRILFALTLLTSPLALAGRKFVVVNEAFLCSKILEAAAKSEDAAFVKPDDMDTITLHRLNAKIIKDLSKIEDFDPENFSTSLDFNINSESLLGFRTLENNLVFLGVNGGGDSTVPVFYLIYWDGKDLRAYLPSDGNTWNTDTKSLYGDQLEETDLANIRKRYAELVDDGIDEIPWDILKVDPELIRQDILARFSELKP